MNDITWRGDASVRDSGTRLTTGTSAVSTADLWRDPKVMVPGIVSIIALSLTLVTVCTCMRRSKFIKMLLGGVNFARFSRR